ncbi:MAG: hypothetical protein JWO37_3717 [Acidimicrobiales bacterium]|jgi:hypothetical protein|nr:hypothetical protein [Acidimicrobiales bacterium]
MSEDSLEAIVDSLESSLEIEQITYYFAHGIDKRDEEKFLGIWTEGATLVSDSHTYQGRDSLRQYLIDIWRELPVSHHYVANNDVRISGDTAEGICDHDVLATTADGETVILAASAFDTYRRVGRTWRIEHRRIETCHRLALPGVELTGNPRPW